VLVSPDGRYRAYAESEAIASKQIDATIAECQNTSTLFVSGPNSGRFRAVLVVKPSPETLGNSLDLIDWSPNGNRLLLTQGSWQWGSDAGGMMVRIYDAESEHLSRELFVDEAFTRYVGKNCAGVFQPLGFSPKGKLVVTAGPFFDVGEDKPVKESCVQQEGTWLIDTAIGTVSQLPKGYKVQHYGKTHAEDRMPGSQLPISRITGQMDLNPPARSPRFRCPPSVRAPTPSRFDSEQRQPCANLYLATPIDA
jgi:hypothetical protein